MALLDIAPDREWHVGYRLAVLLSFGRFLFELHSGPPLRKKVQASARTVAVRAVELLDSVRVLDDQLQLALSSTEPPQSGDFPELRAIDDPLVLLANKARALATVRLKPGDRPKDALNQIALHALSIYEEMSGKRATQWEANDEIEGDADFSERRVPGSPYARFVALVARQLDPTITDYALMAAVTRAVRARKSQLSAPPEGSHEI